MSCWLTQQSINSKPADDRERLEHQSPAAGLICDLTEELLLGPGKNPANNS